MDLEAEAMYLRSEAVLPLIRTGQVTPFDGLAAVVAPGKAVHAASLEAAKEQVVKQVVTIDELAQKLSGG